MNILDRPEIQAQIMAQSQITGYSPEYIANNMMVESGGNPDAVSSAGAQGAMQFMPETWRNLAAQRPDLELTNPFDPEQSLKAYGALIQQIRGNNEMNTERESQVYHGGYDPAGYGPANRDYVERVGRFNQPRLSSAGDASGISSGLPQMPQLQTAMTRPAQLGGENAAAYEQWMQDQIGAREQTPLQAGLEVFGQSMQHAPYMGNRGFGGGFAAALQAGAAKSGRERARDKKLEHDLLRYRADMEAQANKLPNDVELYNYARGQGFKGTYMDYLQEKRPSTNVNVSTGESNRPVLATDDEKEAYGFPKESRPYWFKGELREAKPTAKGGLPTGFEQIGTREEGFTIRPMVGSTEYENTIEGGNELESAIGDVQKLRSLISESGTEAWGETAAEMRTVRRKLLQRLAKAWQMGALSKDEYENMADSIPDPGSFTEFWRDTDSMDAQFKVFEEDYAEKLGRAGKKMDRWGYDDPWRAPTLDEIEAEIQRRSQ